MTTTLISAGIGATLMFGSPNAVAKEKQNNTTEQKQEETVEGFVPLEEGWEIEAGTESVNGKLYVHGEVQLDDWEFGENTLYPDRKLRVKSDLEEQINLYNNVEISDTRNSLNVVKEIYRSGDSTYSVVLGVNEDLEATSHNSGELTVPSIYVENGIKFAVDGTTETEISSNEVALRYTKDEETGFLLPDKVIAQVGASFVEMDYQSETDLTQINDPDDSVIEDTVEELGYEAEGDFDGVEFKISNGVSYDTGIDNLSVNVMASVSYLDGELKGETTQEKIVLMEPEEEESGEPPLYEDKRQKTKKFSTDIEEVVSSFEIGLNYKVDF